MKDRVVKALKAAVAAEVADPQVKKYVRAIALVALAAFVKSFFGVDLPSF